MNDKYLKQRAFFFIMLAILIILALILVWQFVQPILLAIAMVIILKPLYNWLLNRKGINGSATRATGVTMLIFILVIAVPAVLIIGGAISQASFFFNTLGLDIANATISTGGMNNWLNEAVRNLLAGNTQLDDIRLTESIALVITRISEWFRDILINLGRSLPRLFTNTMVVLVTMYVMLSRYKSPGKQDILEIVPFPPEITQLFLDKIDLMIKGMFKGTFVIAITQGLAMGIVFWIVGVPFVIFFTLVSMLLALVPLIGISLVAWPVGLYLIISGEIWRGIFVIAAFLIIVANIDTVLRPYLVPKGAQLNPALIILSVFGGLGLMGIIGALYGPVIMILLVTSLEVYTKYMLRSDLEVLDQQGRIDLKELGLVPQDNPENQNIGEMFLTAVKNVSARFQKENLPRNDGEEDQ
jgi:predicted PurR-regulated permease PerM